MRYVSTTNVSLSGDELLLKVFWQVNVCFTELLSALALAACCHGPWRSVARTVNKPHAFRSGSTVVGHVRSCSSLLGLPSCTARSGPSLASMAD